MKLLGAEVYLLVKQTPIQRRLKVGVAKELGKEPNLSQLPGQFGELIPHFHMYRDEIKTQKAKLHSRRRIGRMGTGFTSRDQLANQRAISGRCYECRNRIDGGPTAVVEIC